MGMRDSPRRYAGGEAPTNPIQAIFAAVLFAAQKHANQRRKGSAAEPDVNPLIEVADLVSIALEEPDTNLVIAALLHDTIEDARRLH